jgi:hypothetical protein
MNIQQLLVKKISLECSASEIAILMGAIKFLAATRVENRLPHGLDLQILIVYSRLYKYLGNRLNSLFVRSKKSGVLSFCLPDLLILHTTLVSDYSDNDLRLVRGKIDQIVVNHSHLVKASSKPKMKTYANEK